MSEIKILGLSGRKCSGKDTVANMIREMAAGWEVQAFADKVKQVASILTGIPVERFNERSLKESILSDDWAKPVTTGLEEPFPGVRFMNLMSVRELMQKIGGEAIRDNVHENAWINALWSQYEGHKWIISDVRYKNEVESIKRRGGLIIRLTRNEDVEETHKSETELDGSVFDYIIRNDSQTVAETRQEVMKMLGHIGII